MHFLTNSVVSLSIVGQYYPCLRVFLAKARALIWFATDAFVHLSQYVVGILLSYVFEEGCGKAPFIKGPPQERKYG